MFYEFSAEAQRLSAAMAQVTDTLQYEPARGRFERNELLSYLRGQNLAAERKRKAALQSVNTPDEAAAYVAGKRRAFAEVMGAVPGETRETPAAKVVSTVRMAGYSVECLLIESLPGYWLTANFYKPEALAGKAPALLFLCGHSDNGKAYGAYAAFCAEAALNGFCVLTFDPVGQGERKFLLDAKEPDSVHCHLGHQMFALGQPLCTYMLYDNIRALDYLLSRPEVDANRAGAVGQSGGGTATAFLAAYDDRLAAAASCCYITELSDLARGIGIQEIEQTPSGFLSAGLGLADLVIAAAPKPYLISSVLFDFFPIEGARDAALEARSVYQRLGAADDLHVYCSPKPHGFWTDCRRTALTFFCHYLQGSPPRVVCTERVEIPSEPELYAAYGDVNGLNKTLLIDHARQRSAQSARPLAGESALADAANLLKLPGNPGCPCEEPSPGQFTLTPEPGLTVYATLTGDFAGQVMTVFAGTPPEVPDGMTGPVLCVEPRGTGRAALPPGCFYTDTNDRYMNREAAAAWNAILHGRSLLGMRALDIAAGVALARRLGAKEITLTAAESLSLPALFAAITAKPDALTLPSLLTSYREVTHQADYTATVADLALGLGRDYDVAGIVSALRARGLDVTLEP